MVVSNSCTCTDYNNSHSHPTTITTISTSNTHKPSNVNFILSKITEASHTHTHTHTHSMRLSLPLLCLLVVRASRGEEPDFQRHTSASNYTSSVTQQLHCNSTNPVISDAWCNKNCNNQPVSCPKPDCQCTGGTSPPVTPDSRLEIDSNTQTFSFKGKRELNP